MFWVYFWIGSSYFECPTSTHSWICVNHLVTASHMFNEKQSYNDCNAEMHSNLEVAYSINSNMPKLGENLRSTDV